MTSVKKIYSVFERKPDPGGHGLKRTRQTKSCSPAPFDRNRNDLVHLFQTLGIEAEFLGHLDQLLRSFRILDGFGEPAGSVGLIAIVVGLGHRSTFLDEYGLRQKGSRFGTRPDMAG
jgi:hypothetical protein